MIEKAQKQILQAKKLVADMTDFLKDLEDQLPEEQKKLYQEMKDDLLQEVQKNKSGINTEKITEKWKTKISNFDK